MLFIKGVGALRIFKGTGKGPFSSTALRAAPYALITALLFGQQARKAAACVIGNTPSGRPTSSKARSASIATERARGAASPLSPLAKMAVRRKGERGASPESSIRPREHTAASGPLPAGA